MNKAILFGVPAIVIIGGAFWYYPNYQAPKTHDIISEQFALAKLNLIENYNADLNLIKHETNNERSYFEVDFIIPTTQEMQTLRMPKEITIKTTGNVILNAIPSMAGYERITTTSYSPDINLLLENLGHKEGFTLDCDTTPKNRGTNTDCKAQELMLQNPNASSVSEITEIKVAASSLKFELQKKALGLNLKLPSLQFLNKDKELAIIDGINFNLSSPHDPAQGSIFKTLSGQTTPDGKTNGGSSIKKITITPGGSDNTMSLQDIKFIVDSVTEKGISSGKATFDLGTASGLPHDITGLNYNFSAENLKTSSVVAIQNLVQEKIEAYSTGFDIADKNEKEILSHVADFLAVGPRFSLSLELVKIKEKVLALQMSSVLKENSKKEALAFLNKLETIDSRDPASFIPLILKHLTINIDATVNNEIANELAMTFVSKGPQPAAQANPQQLQQTASQSLAMLEIMGVVAKDDMNLTSKFSASEKGIFLNGKDISPLIGLPAAP